MRTEQMGIRVRIGDQLLRYTRGESLIQTNGNTIREVIEQLIVRHPAMRPCLFHPDNPNQVRQVMHVYHNGKEVRDSHDLAAPVKQGDEVTIVPDIA